MGEAKNGEVTGVITNDRKNYKIYRNNIISLL